MSTEEELLNSVFDLEQSESTMDEDLLLGEISRKSTVDSIDTASQNDSALADQKHDCVDGSFEKEELDYEDEDEDEERRERTSKFASERRQEGGTENMPNGISDGDGPKKFENMRGNFNNRGIRGRGQWRGRGGNDRGRGGFGSGRGVFPSLPSQNFNGMPGGPAFMNTQFRGPAPSAPVAVRLKLDGDTQIFAPQMPPPQFGIPPTGTIGPIVPRLPNGIPLVGLPSNHGMAGFGQPHNSRMMIPPNGMSSMRMDPIGAQWDQAVESFLKGSLSSNARSSRRRSSSYSSRSSFSSSSRSRSRSSSRSPSRRRRRRNESSSRREDSRRNEGYNRNRNGGDRHRHNEDRRRERKQREQQQKNTTIECVKAIGLTEDYLDKLKEQDKKREEIIRRKEQRRFGDKKEDKDRERTSDHRRINRSQQSHSSQPTSSQPQTSAEMTTNEREKKLKAYLSVNVNNLKDLTTAVKRVEAMAKTLGQIRKCWKSSEDTVSVIFVAHEKAKEFMLKYNNQVLSGLRINVALEKKYLNLSDMP